MTDAQLIAAAAKAVNGGAWHPLTHDTPNGAWNPLTDDGDALRLAVKLGIQSHYSDFTGNAYVRWDRGEKTDAVYGPDDPYAATRRAIVRAAAAMAPKEPT